MSSDRNDSQEQVLHIRRCHICDHVTTSSSAAIHKCEQCGKHLAPFYYFDESKLEGLSELGPYLSGWKSVNLEPGTFNPIWGLSTYWQDDYEGNTRRRKEGSSGN